MAYQAGGTNYGQMLEQRRMSDEGLNRALDRKGRADKQARIKKSGQRSGFQQLAAGVARGAAAYYTGGLSEQMGAGEMIDEATLGTDSEGNSVKSQYGGLVKAGSSIYQGSKAQKAGKLGKQDAKFDKLMDRREKNVKMLFEAGDKKGAMKAQSAMEDMRLTYDTNRKDAEGKGWGGSGLGMSDEDYNLQPTAMTPEQRAAKVTRLNKGGEPDTQAIIGDQGRRQEGQLGVPPTADAPKAPDLSQVGSFERPTYETQGAPEQPKGPTSFGVSDTSRGVQPVSAAETATAPSSQYKLQGEERKREQDDLIERITGGGDKAPSSDQMRQNRAVGSWMRTPLTVQPNEEGRAIDVTGKWGDKWKQRNAIKQGRG
jgi:hypothetical protein